MLMLTVHSALVVVANIFANIQLCYKLMQFDVPAISTDSPIGVERPDTNPTGEGATKTLFPQLSVVPSERSFPYIDDEPSSRSVTQENTPRRDDDANVPITDTVLRQDNQNSPIQKIVSREESKSSRNRRSRENKAGLGKLNLLFFCFCSSLL